ncbi:putative reverse transcriptase domain-containing protein [Tanacetum coccineum]
MAISVIPISSDSSEESVGTSTARVILFSMILTAIPTTVPIVDPLVVHDDTPLIPIETPTIPVSTLPHTSLFMYTDSSDSDTPERPPSQEPYEVTVSWWRSRVAARSSPPSPPTRQILPAPPGLPRRPTILVLPGQPIPVGRPYRTQPNGVRKMLIARKRVRALPSGQHASRYLLTIPPNVEVFFDLPNVDDVTFELRLLWSCLVTVVARVEVDEVKSGTSVDVVVRGLNRFIQTSFDIEVRGLICCDQTCIIDANTTVSEAAAARKADARVEVDTRIDSEDEVEEEAESSHRGTIEIGVDTVVKPVVSEDTPMPTDDRDSRDVVQLGLDEIIQELHDHLEEISVIEVLERDNMRLRAMLGIERELIDSLRCHMAYTQEELRQMRRFRYYDCMEFRRLETYARRRLGIMPTATCIRMTPAAIEDMIERRMAEALEAYQNREPTRENEDGYGDDNGNDHGNGNGDGGGNGNGNGLGRGNGNGNPNVNNGALTWWNSQKKTVRTDAAYAMTWKTLMKPMTKVLRIGFVVHQDGPRGGGSEPTRLQDVVRIANSLMDQKLKGYDNVARAYTIGNSEKRGYAGPLPYCNKCKFHHEGQCTVKCGNCKRVGHITRDCRATIATATQGAPEPNQKVVTYYECGRQGHYRSKCPRLKNQNHGNKLGNKPNEARGRAYALVGGANPDANIVTGKFLLNNHYACMLFDSGADRSFVSTAFSVLLDIVPSTLDASHPFNIDIMLVELGNLDVIIGMNWLSRYHIVIICDEKVVRIPYGNEVLKIQGDGCSGGDKSRLSIISCTKAYKYIQKGCQVFLAQVIEKKAEDKSEEKRLEDVSTVRDFLKVFPEDFPELSPTQ